eukprot:8590533-Karenia_brevis.AAC.1
MSSIGLWQRWPTHLRGLKNRWLLMPGPHTTTDVLYDSQPNSTILCLHSTKKCAKAATEKTVEAWIGNDVPAGQWDVL